MKLINVFSFLFLIPSALSAGHEVEEVVSAITMNETVPMEMMTEDMLTEIASEVMNTTVASMGEEGIANVASTILDAIAAVEESATGFTGGASDLVQQVINEVLGTASPTPAPTVYVAPETQVDLIIGQVTDTVNTVADASASILNEVFNESPTATP